jgi:uncharacterized damage-inducible protein DinB
MQSVRSIIDSLARAPEIIIPLVREVPAHLRQQRPALGKWSVHEHACHLAEVHPVFLERLDTMLRERKTRIIPYDPERSQQRGALLAMDLDDALDRFERDRARLIGLLRTLTPEQWAIEASHGEYNRYSVFIMFRHLAMHDMLHAYRIEELLLKNDWAEETIPA